MSLPSPFETMSDKQKNRIVDLFDKICNKQAQLIDEGISDEERQVNTLFYSIFGLSEFEVEVMEDVYLY